MEISHSEIGKKVCETKKGGSTHKDNYGKYAPGTDGATASKNDTALCGGKGGENTGGATSSPQSLKEFVKETLLNDGSKNWPTSTSATTGTDKPAPKTNDNANAVATDLTKLTPEEKTIVAGLLTKTIEGGEVVEIRAVSSIFIRIRDELLSLLPLLTWEWKIAH
ncbi:hypothetical protein ANAPC5_00036 [Anaplasma phagocytophilum]|nr:hypothetical protein ANAPC3_00040 [Anaplasma phagocytophilum]SBO30488.1 hypothetical protein ANAPC2_00270 [Anaplasma phagocytophilum]SBO31286.1 hypothetical protein ANAPC4_00440 [Anaplasma phagocytophilum]SCV61644.1 hypothetical protein ANAPC5_00036 [Anaplasma phagocytophilum]